MSFGLLQHEVKSCHILAQGLIALSPALVAVVAKSFFLFAQENKQGLIEEKELLSTTKIDIELLLKS
jgi:hypothetical protein